MFVDIEKIELVMSWYAPTNVVEVRSFIGLVSYYHRLVKDFSRITNPITSIQKKNQNFK